MATSVMRSSKRQRERRERDPIAALIAIRSGMVARGEYKPIGKIMQIHTAAGVIEFGKRGPAVGRLINGTFELLDPWPGAPMMVKQTEELCPACQTKCDECSRGYRKCMQGQGSCGGSGKVKAGEEECRCVKRSGRASPKCKTCLGYGALPILKDCEWCGGKGKVKCRLCLGTGKMSTGRLDGSKERNAPNCPECDCTGHRLEKNSQDMEAHITVTKDAVSLGPIRGLLVRPAAGVGADTVPRWWSASADDKGNYLMLVMKQFTPGVRATLLGGILVPHENSASA